MLTGVNPVTPPADSIAPLTISVTVVPPPVTRRCQRCDPSQSSQRNAARSVLALMDGAPHTSLAEAAGARPSPMADDCARPSVKQATAAAARCEQEPPG